MRVPSTYAVDVCTEPLVVLKALFSGIVTSVFVVATNVAFVVSHLIQCVNKHHNTKVCVVAADVPNGPQQKKWRIGKSLQAALPVQPRSASLK